MNPRRMLIAVLVVGMSVLIVWSFMTEEPQKAADARERGDSLWKKADFDGAIAAYTEVIQLSEGHNYLRRRCRAT